MDENYIRQVLNGDKNAFRYIVTKYKDKSYTLAMSIVKSEYIAEDVVQDAFIKAFQNLDSFKGKSKFSTWLYRIVVNESLKKIKQNKLITITDKILFEETHVEASNNILDKLHEFDRREIIHNVLKNMVDAESLILRLFYLEEKSIEEISEITSLKQSNVKVILFRARKRFYFLLEKQFKHELKSML